MTTAIDSNVLFDIVLDDPVHGDASRDALMRAAAAGRTVVAPVVYAELASRFATGEELEGFFHDMDVRIDGLPADVLFAAGQAWAAYAGARPRQVACAHCGQALDLGCPACRREYRPRQHVLADFLIGAHATLRADRLLTRDEGYFRRYFPSLSIGVPA